MRGEQANGEQLRSARKARGLTQEEFAALAGIDVKTLRKAEHGKSIDLGTLTRISLVLDLEISKLIIARGCSEELMSRRRDAVLRWLRAWDARDLEGLLSVFHDDAVLHLPGGPDIPFAGEHRGKEAMRRANEMAWTTCETVPMTSHENIVVASDDSMIYRVREGIRMPDGDIVHLWATHIFTFLEGTDLIAEQQVEYDTLTFAKLLQIPITNGRLRGSAVSPANTSKTSR